MWYLSLINLFRVTSKLQITKFDVRKLETSLCYVVRNAFRHYLQV